MEAPSTPQMSFNAKELLLIVHCLNIRYHKLQERLAVPGNEEQAQQIDALRHRITKIIDPNV